MSNRLTVTASQQRRQTSIGMPDDMRRQILFICALRGESISEFARRAFAAEIMKNSDVFPAARKAVTE